VGIRIIVVPLEEKASSQIRAEAAKRGIEVDQLAAMLLERIVEDELFTAVLDD
jgi:hypothetical protein